MLVIIIYLTFYTLFFYNLFELARDIYLKRKRKKFTIEGNVKINDVWYNVFSDGSKVNRELVKRSKRKLEDYSLNIMIIVFSIAFFLKGLS